MALYTVLYLFIGTAILYTCPIYRASAFISLRSFKGLKRLYCLISIISGIAIWPISYAWHIIFPVIYKKMTGIDIRPIFKKAAEKDVMIQSSDLIIDSYK